MKTKFLACIIACLSVLQTTATAGLACPNVNQLGRQFSTAGLHKIGTVADQADMTAYAVQIEAGQSTCAVNVAANGLLTRIIKRRITPAACAEYSREIRGQLGVPDAVHGAAMRWQTEEGTVVVYQPGSDGDCAVHWTKTDLIVLDSNRPALDSFLQLETHEPKRFLLGLEGLPFGTTWKPRGAATMKSAGDKQVLSAFQGIYPIPRMLILTYDNNRLTTVSAVLPSNKCPYLKRAALALKGTGRNVAPGVIRWPASAGKADLPRELIMESSGCIYSVGNLE